MKEQFGLKTCNRCKLTKPTSDFHHNKTRPDGYQYSCKDCSSKYAKRYDKHKYVKKLKEKTIEKCLVCGKDFEKKIINQIYCSYKCCDIARYYKNRSERLKEGKLMYEANKKEWFAKSERMRKKYPEKYKARMALKCAVTKGDIKKLPCEICGFLPAEAHHEDYSKPLIVRWLCRTHHHQLHRKYDIKF